MNEVETECSFRALYVLSSDKGATPGRELEKDGREGDEKRIGAKERALYTFTKDHESSQDLTRTPL